MIFFNNIGFANIESVANTNIGITSASLDIPKLVNIEKNEDSFRKSVVFIIIMQQDLKMMKKRQS